MRFVAVDLAAKYSAAMGVDGSNPATPLVEWQGSSYPIGEDGFLELLTAPFVSPHLRYGYPSDLIVEDLPHGVRYNAITKRVCQIQGRIKDRMNRLGYGDRILFLPPQVWQRYFGVSGKPELFEAKALERGYCPPTLDEIISTFKLDYEPKAPEKKMTRKIRTDFIAAFLIGCWAVDQYTLNGTVDANLTSRYSDNYGE